MGSNRLTKANLGSNWWILWNRKNKNTYILEHSGKQNAISHSFYIKLSSLIIRDSGYLHTYLSIEIMFKRKHIGAAQFTKRSGKTKQHIFCNLVTSVPHPSTTVVEGWSQWYVSHLDHLSDNRPSCQKNHLRTAGNKKQVYRKTIQNPSKGTGSRTFRLM